MIVKAMPISPPPVIMPISVLVKPKLRAPLAEHLGANAEPDARGDQGQKAGPKDFAVRLHVPGSPKFAGVALGALAAAKNSPRLWLDAVHERNAATDTDFRVYRSPLPSKRTRTAHFRQFSDLLASARYKPPLPNMDCLASHAIFRGLNVP